MEKFTSIPTQEAFGATTRPYGRSLVALAPSFHPRRTHTQITNMMELLLDADSPPRIWALHIWTFRKLSSGGLGARNRRAIPLPKSVYLRLHEQSVPGPQSHSLGANQPPTPEQ
jgi:hypothetical protein